jgi:hypothetical protein
MRRLMALVSILALADDAWAGEWHVETVDSEHDGLYNSLALDSSGYPHISYYDFSNSAFKYARWNGSTWQIQTVDASGDVGLYTSLALDSLDHPHISYFNGTSEDLKYARWNGDIWCKETVDSNGDVGWYTSLVVDPSDNTHIAYYDKTNGALKYAHWNGSSWQTRTIDSAGDVGQYTSLVLDSSGNPHISYYDEGNTSLKYAYWEGGSGVEGAELTANVNDDGVLVGWTVTGDAPVSLSILRSVGEDEPVAVSGALPGEAMRWLDTKVETGVEYRYWLETIDTDGTVSRFGPTEAVTFPGAARELSLSVYPSPASGSFTVDYTLPQDGRVKISLYDLSGRRVATVFDGETTAGRHELACDASMLPPGVYLVHFDTHAGSLTRRVVITR